MTKEQKLREQKLREAVFLYIEAKKRLTSCMQKHFKQVCHSCKEYAGCLVYSGYVSAWINLQDSYYVEQKESKEKIDDSVPLNDNVILIYGKLSESKQEVIFTIFEFWNYHKESGKWQGHRKLNKDMVEAILSNLKNYSLDEICGAIHNYAKILQSDAYYWDHIWPLSTFLTVKDGKYKDAPKKWVQKFLPENFVLQNWLKKNGYVNGNSKELVEDPNPKLTYELISSLQRWGLCKKGLEPSPKQLGQFRLTVQRMMEFYKDRTCQDEKIWVEDLYDCLDQNYLGKGDTVPIGLLCSDYLWDILMPQLLRSCGDM